MTSVVEYPYGAEELGTRELEAGATMLELGKTVSVSVRVLVTVSVT